MMVHYVLRCILHREAFGYCFMVLNTFMAFLATNESEGEKRAKQIKCNRRFKIFVGSVMSDKNKGSFYFAGIGQQSPSCVLMPFAAFCLSSATYSESSFKLVAFKLSSRHIISILGLLSGLTIYSKTENNIARKNSILYHIGISNKL
jgi:hypothetical protein